MRLTLNKLTPLLAAGGLLLAATDKASAFTFDYVDVDVINQSLTGPGGSFSGSFNFDPGDADVNTFTANGYGPADGTYNSVFGYTIGTPIIEGTITFFFLDPNGGTETGIVTADFTNVGGVTTFANYSVFSQGLELSLLATITSTGKLDYTVTSNSGDFELVAGIGTITVSVPDTGSTMAMFGGSLLGVAALRKRFAKRKA